MKLFIAKDYDALRALIDILLDSLVLKINIDVVNLRIMADFHSYDLETLLANNSNIVIGKTVDYVYVTE